MQNKDSQALMEILQKETSLEFEDCPQNATSASQILLALAIRLQLLCQNPGFACS